MNYFLKQQGKIALGGPFTIEQINEQIRNGILNSETLATANLGESASQIENAPDRDWMYLGEVPGISGVGKSVLSPVVFRTSVFGRFSVAAPFMGVLFGFMMAALKGSSLWLIPLSMVVGVILAFFAWSRGDIWLGWIGFLLNSALLLFIIYCAFSFKGI